MPPPWQLNTTHCRPAYYAGRANDLVEQALFAESPYLLVGAADEAHEQRCADRREQDVRQHDTARRRAGHEDHHQNTDDEKRDHQYQRGNPASPDAGEVDVPAPFALLFASSAAAHANGKHGTEDHEIVEA